MAGHTEIISFWFEQAGPKKWYNGGDGFDALVRERFETTAVTAAAVLEEISPHDWEQTPDTALALILMLDQFPRNMYRGTRGAFAFDALALAAAQRAVVNGFDLKLPQERRIFIYMPYMHAEDIEMQDECVRLTDMRVGSESSLFHARAHQELISRFGRFPHRNEILGRASSKEEQDFLHQGGYSP